MKKDIRTMSDREVLKEYLWQYDRAKSQKKILENRLKEFRIDIGISGMNYAEFSHGSSPNNGGPSASQAIRMVEIEERIEKQKQECQRTLLEIMKVMDFLSMADEYEALERKIIESRHIDRMGWEEVCKVVALTRSPCAEHYNNGLDKLLTYKRVQQIVKRYRRELETLKRKR